MYDTSTEDTIVPWTAGRFAMSFVAEIGHFPYVSAANPRTGKGKGREGTTGDGGRADRDDVGRNAQYGTPLVQPYLGRRGLIGSTVNVFPLPGDACPGRRADSPGSTVGAEREARG